MSRRATHNGHLFRDMVVAALNAKRFTVNTEVDFAENLFEGKGTRADIVVEGAADYPEGLIVSAKYQEAPGSVEQKIVYEVLNLQALPLPSILVIGGAGYSTPARHWAKANAKVGNLVEVFDDPNEYMRWAFALEARE